MFSNCRYTEFLEKMKDTQSKILMNSPTKNSYVNHEVIAQIKERRLRQLQEKQQKTDM
jgi:hypothetical protein